MHMLVNKYMQYWTSKLLTIKNIKIKLKLKYGMASTNTEDLE